MGLPETLKFSDLFSLDLEFLQFTAQPVFAVLLLFPCRGKLDEERKREEETGEGEWKGSEDEDKKIWWIKQTDSPLAKFYQETKDMSGVEKAAALDAATFFEEAHKRVAESGQSTVPRTAEELEQVDLHFISFVEGTAADGLTDQPEKVRSTEGHVNHYSM
ncbi:hypothetical protein QFC19_005782 [Naganishia cerealis]|uniref:Uncharacterized protein n=1 Tax=Naganishia cerealis TaxID=610337 RepID=A0ACC2VLC7_9TREE|nr:hypothetical protein QFC19_005782 [Naganishia cerealis]